TWVGAGPPRGCRGGFSMCGASVRTVPSGAVADHFLRGGHVSEQSFLGLSRVIFRRVAHVSEHVGIMFQYTSYTRERSPPPSPPSAAEPGHGPFLAGVSHGSGSTGVPPMRTSKCRWGPVE